MAKNAAATAARIEAAADAAKAAAKADAGKAAGAARKAGKILTEEELLKGLEGLAPPEERPEPVEPDEEE